MDDKLLFLTALFHPELVSRTCGRYCFGCESPGQCKNKMVKIPSNEISSESEVEDDDNS